MYKYESNKINNCLWNYLKDGFEARIIDSKKLDIDVKIINCKTFIKIWKAESERNVIATYMFNGNDDIESFIIDIINYTYSEVDKMIDTSFEKWNNFKHEVYDIENKYVEIIL